MTLNMVENLPKTEPEAVEEARTAHENNLDTEQAATEPSRSSSASYSRAIAVIVAVGVALSLAYYPSFVEALTGGVTIAANLGDAAGETGVAGGAGGASEAGGDATVATGLGAAAEEREANAPESAVDVCGVPMAASTLPGLDCSGFDTSGAPPAGKFPNKICPWPDQSQQILSPRWPNSPGGSEYSNFTVQAARDLLRGTTVVIAGDSTSRRLMWTMCKFLANETGRVDGSGCCGTKRVTIYCDRLAPELDILLLYQPVLLGHDVHKYFHTSTAKGLLQVSSFRQQPLLQGSWSNNISAARMPPSKTALAHHVFAPVFSWHVNTTACDELPPKRALDTGDRCGYGDLLTGGPIRDFLGAAAEDNSTATACALNAAFCEQFVGAVEDTFGKDTAPFHGYILSNLPAAPATFRKTHEGSNPWQVVMTKAGVCAEDPSLTGRRGGGGGISPSGHGHTCGAFDQTSFFLNWTEPLAPRRLGCYPSDGYSSLHVYNEYGHLMRIHALLSTIRKRTAAGSY